MGEPLTEIGLLSDKHTATCFKLAGLNAVFPVSDPTQAGKIVSELVEKTNLRILLVSEQILSKLQFGGKTSEQDFPLIIPIFGISSGFMLPLP